MKNFEVSKYIQRENRDSFKLLHKVLHKTPVMGSILSTIALLGLWTTASEKVSTLKLGCLCSLSLPSCKKKKSKISKIVWRDDLFLSLSEACRFIKNKNKELWRILLLGVEAWALFKSSRSAFNSLSIFFERKVDNLLNTHLSYPEFTPFKFFFSKL